MSTTSSGSIDPRGTRFSAAITSGVLAAAVLLGPHTGLMLLVAQTLVFAAGALLGPARQPYGWLFRHAVRPRLGPPAHTEPSAPPRFAQAVGLGFALLGLAGAVAGADVVFFVALGFALLAAVLNATIGFCLGCELFLLVQRVRRRATGSTRSSA
ncbi:MAG: DUF4395 domain-containing protein [Propioniciclava sp.]